VSEYTFLKEYEKNTHVQKVFTPLAI